MKIFSGSYQRTSMLHHPHQKPNREKCWKLLNLPDMQFIKYKKKLLQNKIIAYTAAGVLIGLFLRAVTFYFQLMESGLDFSVIDIIQLHETGKLVWVIDLAPVIIGSMFYYFSSIITRKNDVLVKLKQRDAAIEQTARFA